MAEEANTTDDTENLTVRGHLAYALCYVEQAFLKTGVRSAESGMVLDLLWSMADCDSIGDWDDMRREGQSGEYYCSILDHLDALNGSPLQLRLPERSPLLEIDVRIMRMLEATDDLVMRYVYENVPPGAPGCTEHALAVAALGQEFDLEQPPISLFQGCIVSLQEPQNDFWGDAIPTQPFRAWVKQQAV